jgi:hypothetical protein
MNGQRVLRARQVHLAYLDHIAAQSESGVPRHLDGALDALVG